jgi:hypothetical protein
VPKPHVFASESELIDALGRKRTTNLATSFFAKRVHTLRDVVALAIGSNTYRAFRNLPVRPSATFREWAEARILNGMPPLGSGTAQREYAAYVHASTLALCRYWQRATGAEMGYGRGAKLLNLVLKKLACLASLTEQQRRALIALQHIPLDSYTLVGLRAVAPELSIPRSATMKYIETPKQYTVFQERIAAIARKAQVPPIYYDILAWNMRHDG